MRPAARVQRGPAALDWREPPLAVWRGEIVVLAGPWRSELVALLQATRVHRDGRIATAWVDPEWGATACADVLFTRVGPARGLVAALALVPDASGRRTLAAIRRAVATRVPCRCMWVVDGRRYPE